MTTNLETIVLETIEDKKTKRKETLTIRDAVRGIHIFGAIGSGKTSGSGRALALGYLRAGFGGLILTAKDEKKLWKKEYCEETGRGEDLIILEENGYKFDFINFAFSLWSGLSQVTNTINLISLITDIATPAKSEQESYWMNTKNQLIRNTVNFLLLARQPISLENVHKLILDAPRTKEGFYSTVSQEPKKQTYQSFFEKKQEKKDDSFFQKTYKKIDVNKLNEREKKNLLRIMRFWSIEFPAFPEKTRESIVSIVTSAIDPFLDATISYQFCSGKSEIDLRSTFQNKKIILLNFPPEGGYGNAGRQLQIILKYIWQETIRTTKNTEIQNPTFLWADESQLFLYEKDKDFQALCREKEVATVYLTQNISNYYATIGGKTPKESTDALLACFGTKIFHQNMDAVTNQWAAEQIGKDYRIQESNSVSWSDSGNGKHTTSGKTTQSTLDFIVPPIEFQQLSEGGDFELVEGIILKAGLKTFQNKRQSARVLFEQKDIGQIKKQIIKPISLEQERKEKEKKEEKQGWIGFFGYSSIILWLILAYVFYMFFVDMFETKIAKVASWSTLILTAFMVGAFAKYSWKEYFRLKKEIDHHKENLK